MEHIYHTKIVVRFTTMCTRYGCAISGLRGWKISLDPFFLSSAWGYGCLLVVISPLPPFRFSLVVVQGTRATSLPRHFCHTVETTSELLCRYTAAAKFFFNFPERSSVWRYRIPRVGLEKEAEVRKARRLSRISEHTSMKVWRDDT